MSTPIPPLIPGTANYNTLESTKVKVVDEINAVDITTTNVTATSVTTDEVTIPNAGVTIGTATLASGTVTVATTSVVDTDIILVTQNTPGGTTGVNYSVPVGSITDDTSFVINAVGTDGSVVNTDESTVNWVIIHTVV